MNPEETKLKRLMDRAARAALRGSGCVEPNPTVGCVIETRSGELITARHGVYGGLHAEAAAVARAKQMGLDVTGARCIVTLEPCAHVGKQPPCSHMLVREGVGEVVFAVQDPHEQGQGGAAILDAGGIAWREWGLSKLAMYSSAAFRKRVTEGLPWVIVKWAQTIDGAIATRKGESKWVSNKQSRRDVHRLRGRVDAVLTGMGTVRADDPLLNVRGVIARREPVAVVLDPRGELGEGVGRSLAHRGRVISVGGARVHETGNGEFLEGGIGYRHVAVDGSGHADLRAVLRQLLQRDGVSTVLVEAGPGVISKLFEAKLVDELRVYVAPGVLGDAEGMRAVSLGEMMRMPGSDDARGGWRLCHAKRFSDDLRLTYVRRGWVEPGVSARELA